MRHIIRLLTLPVAAAAISFVGSDADASLDHSAQIAIAIRCPPPEPIGLRELLSELQPESRSFSGSAD